MSAVAWALPGHGIVFWWGRKEVWVGSVHAETNYTLFDYQRVDRDEGSSRATSSGPPRPAPLPLSAQQSNVICCKQKQICSFVLSLKRKTDLSHSLVDQVFLITIYLLN